MGTNRRPVAMTISYAHVHHMWLGKGKPCNYYLITLPSKTHFHKGRQYLSFSKSDTHNHGAIRGALHLTTHKSLIQLPERKYILCSPLTDYCSVICRQAARLSISQLPHPHPHILLIKPGSPHVARVNSRWDFTVHYVGFPPNITQLLYMQYTNQFMMGSDKPVIPGQWLFRAH